MNPLVSVIMPAYNAAAHIGDSIASVIGQTCGEWELLIVDDGSTDGTADAVRIYQDDRIRYIGTKNQGNYHARNRALAEARGRFVAFIDADDVWDSEKLKAQTDVFGANPDVGLCCTDHYVFEGKEQNRRYIDSLHGFREEYFYHERFLDEQLLENRIITSSVMLRHDCVRRLGPFDTSYQNAMDYELWLRVMLNYRTRYLRERFVFKRIHPGNISRNQITSQRAVLYICRKMDTYMRNTVFFQPHHRDLIHRKIQYTMYMLGMEYLSAREYELADYYLSKSRYKEKKVFLLAAQTAARLRFDPAVVLVNAWRRQRQKRVLVTEV
jgi:glycosyltransferase involved in cell wall biosynthesis